MHSQDYYSSPKLPQHRNRIKAWFFLHDIENVPLDPLEARYIEMFMMRKSQNLWPWQWGAADEPCSEHILAIGLMDGFYNEAEAFKNKDKPKEQADQQIGN